MKQIAHVTQKDNVFYVASWFDKAGAAPDVRPDTPLAPRPPAPQTAGWQKDVIAIAFLAASCAGLYGAAKATEAYIAHNAADAYKGMYYAVPLATPGLQNLTR